MILTSKLMRSLPIAALTFALGTVMTPAAAQSPAEFYKGKTITIMLGHPPGGSYDLYARLAALREAFDKVVKDPEFIADAAKRSADLEPTPGDTVQACSDRIARAPGNVIEAATRAIAAEKADKK